MYLKEKEQDEDAFINPPRNWTEWAKHLRTNSKMNAEQIAEKSEKDKEAKVPISILRAREESKNLMQSNVDINSEINKIDIPYRKNALGRRSEIHRYSVFIDENEYTNFLENQMFVMSRTWGTTITILALAFNIYVLVSQYWFVMGDKYHPTNAGLILICESHNDSCMFLYSHWNDIPNWTKLLFGFLSLSSLVGLSGFIIAVIGFINRPVQKQMYYYHSSGEFSVIACSLIAFGLLVFWASDRHTLKFNSFGMSFWMCITCGLLYFLAFILLTIDEIYARVAAHLNKNN